MDFKYLLRWLAILPGSILAGIVILFPLHWILYFALTKFIEPYPMLPEKILGPGLSAWAMVVAGSNIAPKFKKVVAIIIGGMWVIFVSIVFVLALNDNQLGTLKLEIYAGGLPVIGGIIGAVFGIFSVISKKENEDDN